MVEPISLMNVASEYGIFIALVVYVLWRNEKREKQSRERESEFINETRVREARYIEREDKYIEVIESFTQIREDVSYIKSKLDEKGV